MFTTWGCAFLTTGPKPVRLGPSAGFANLNVAGGFTAAVRPILATPNPPMIMPAANVMAAAGRPKNPNFFKVPSCIWAYISIDVCGKEPVYSPDSGSKTSPALGIDSESLRVSYSMAIHDLAAQSHGDQIISDGHICI